MRNAVIDTNSLVLMPCHPAKARLLFKAGKAKPKWNKLGLFCVQLTYEQEPDNQPLVVGVDPGSKKDCRVLTWVAFHSWWVSLQPPSKGRKGRPTPVPKKEGLLPPLVETQGSPQAD